MFACREQFVRNMPCRLVGETLDRQGRRGFVLTLATREQHIRREKATSNICSNQGICAMTAAMYMASLGGTGLRRLARLNYDKAQYCQDRLGQVGGKVLWNSPVFNEFVIEFAERDFSPVRQRLLAAGIVAGLDLGRFYPEHAGRYLFGITETVERAVIDRVAEEVEK
jgi:glycine dehydrogenase subunit 1